MSSNDIAAALAAGLGMGLLVAVLILIRAIWRKITDPEAARRLGKTVRRSVDGAANVAGQAAGSIETVVKSAGKQFSDGRKQKDES